MLQDGGLRKYLGERVTEWAKRMERSRSDKDRDDLKFFLARFDPGNYTFTPQPEGGVLVTMSWPAELEAKARESQDKAEMGMLSMALAARARAYLSGRRELAAEEVPKLAQETQRLANWNPSGADSLPAQYRTDSIAGGIAVLIVQQRAWLSRNPDIEKWCMETLRGLKPAENTEHDTPRSALNHSAESFLGEAGVALLQERSDEWVLRLAFEGVTGFYYNATFQTMWRAYLLREGIGEKFDELVNVVVLWSALRRGADSESGYQANQTLLAKYRETLFRRYAAGKLRKGFISLLRAESLGHSLAERIVRRTISPGERRAREERKRQLKIMRRESGRERKLYREIPSVDFEVIQKGFGFLPAMARAPLAGDERRLKRYVRELYELEMRTLPRPEPGEEDHEIEGTAYGFDAWIMTRVVEFIVQANSIETARPFYRPILELGPAARYWTEDFLQAWIGMGLEMAQDGPTFASIWRDMVEYAMGLPAWQPGKPGYWCRAESLAVDLMGLHEQAAGVLGQAKYKDIVAAMAPVYQAWGSQWLKYGSIAAWFAHFLPTESGRVLLAQGVKQLADVVGSFPDGDWHRYSLGAVLTDALAACLKYSQQEVESQPELRKAFLGMLTTLCARQIPEALHLRSKVSEVLVA